MTSTLYPRIAIGLVFLFGACTDDGEPGGGNPDGGAAVCGNGTCEASETAASCSADCTIPTCGNGTCDANETAISCPADCHTTCGDGVCEVGETISSCAADCAAATCTVADPNSCTGETVCIAGTCENAFGRNYKITVTSAVFTEKKADGSSWDIGGGLPDGKVILTVNGAAHTTPVINDTLTPVWNFITPPVLIPGGTNLKIEVVDADVAADDPAWLCVANPLSAELIRKGARCSGQGQLAAAHVDFKFTPN